MTPSALAAAMEVALNRLLRLEPATAAGLRELQGKRIGIAVTPFDWYFLIEGLPGGLRVAADEREPAPHAELSSSAVQLVQKGLDMARGAPFSAQGLQVRGDAELLQRFASRIALVGVDLEEWLAPWLGDGAAHRAAGLLSGLFGWGRRSAGLLVSNTAEYLREESQDLARRADVEAWMDEVDLLRDGVDRLDARLRRLERA
jgi:ubiquinone biosynthesis accessory factor UbiJ